MERIPNTEADLKGYDVYRMRLNDSTILHLNLSSVDRQTDRFTDIRAEAGTPYRYHITDSDSSGSILQPSEYFYATFAADSDTGVKNPLSSFRTSYRPDQKHVSMK